MSKTRPPEGADAGSAVRARDYIPRDRMFLFWLRDPAAPVLVGALYDLGLVEHATMTLARLAGLDPAQTRPIDLGGGAGPCHCRPAFRPPVDRCQRSCPA